MSAHPLFSVFTVCVVIVFFGPFAQAHDPHEARGNKPKPKPVERMYKHIRQAQEHQKEARLKIIKGKNEAAIKDQSKSIAELDKARLRLIQLLKQIREEEMRQMLATLKQRCRRMLQMQVRVRAATVQLHAGINNEPGKQPNNLQQKAARKLADDENRIAAECSKALAVLKAEGSAVAFPEVFKLLRDDMQSVAKRLDIVDAGEITIAIENDIIDTLKEMIQALEKSWPAFHPPGPGGPGGPGGGGNPGDANLLKLVQELKMIRSLQVRIYNRTKTYGRLCKSEQAEDPLIRTELRQLSQRQDRLHRMTSQIARKENK